jgi:hypothetical protein
MFKESSFHLQDFLYKVLGEDGLARTNRFEVLIIPPPALMHYGKSISLLCEQAQFPPLNIALKGVRINGPMYLRPVAAEFGGEVLPLTFHLDGSMNLKRFFDDWMNLIVNNRTFTVGYQEDYISSVYIRQLNELDLITYEVELIEAFPRGMNIIGLDHNAMNQTNRLTVSFAFRYWQEVPNQEVDYISKPLKTTEPQTYNSDNRVI